MHSVLIFSRGLRRPIRKDKSMVASFIQSILFYLSLFFIELFHFIYRLFRKLNLWTIRIHRHVKMKLLRVCSNHLIRTPMNYNKVRKWFSIRFLQICIFMQIAELEILNRKVSDQIRIGQTYDKTQEQRKSIISF